MSEPPPDDGGTRGPAPTTIGLGVLAVLVVLVLLADLPPTTTLPVVALLVVALGVVGFLAARGRPRSGGAPLGGLGLVGAALWFWGVVTGLSHLLRSVLDDPSGIESVVTGLVTTVVWVALIWFLRRPAVR